MINRLGNKINNQQEEEQFISEIVGLLLEMSTMGGGSVEGGVKTNVNKQKTTATTSTYNGTDIIAMVNKRLKELDNE